MDGCGFSRCVHPVPVLTPVLQGGVFPHSPLPLTGGSRCEFFAPLLPIRRLFHPASLGKCRLAQFERLGAVP